MRCYCGVCLVVGGLGRVEGTADEDAGGLQSVLATSASYSET